MEFANRSTMKEYSMNVSNEGIKQSQNNHNPLENFIFIKKMINLNQISFVRLLSRGSLSEERRDFREGRADNFSC